MDVFLLMENWISEFHAYLLRFLSIFLIYRKICLYWVFPYFVKICCLNLYAQACNELLDIFYWWRFELRNFMPIFSDFLFQMSFYPYSTIHLSFSSSSSYYGSKSIDIRANYDLHSALASHQLTCKWYLLPPPSPST